MTTRVILPSVLVGEQAILEFDFASRLGVGETLVSAFTTPSVWSGVDPSPAALCSGGSTVEGTVVKQKVIPLLVGVVYDLVVGVNTSKGQVLGLSGYLVVGANL